LPNGAPVLPDAACRLFARLAARHGLPPIRLHDLRHVAATLALAAGQDLNVVTRSGHHDAKRCSRRDVTGFVPVATPDESTVSGTT
jgi:integrase